jgi:hypothetical protein
MTSRTFSAIARCSSMLIPALAFVIWPAQSCLADAISTTPSLSDPSVSMLELEASLFGLDQADGYSIAAASQLWTSDANAALYSNMMELILTLGGDSAMINQLFQNGAVFSGPSIGQSVGQSTGGPFASVSFQQSSSSQIETPEPATMGLLGGTLLLLAWYAKHRAAKMRPLFAGPARRPLYGPISTAD